MSCFKGISYLNRCEIIAITNGVSLLLAEGLDTDDLNALGNLIVSIGGVILSFGSQQQ